MAQVNAHWQEDVAPEDDPAFARALGMLAGEAPGYRTASLASRVRPPPLKLRQTLERLFRAARPNSLAGAGPLVSIKPSHKLVDRPSLPRWFLAHPGMRPLFFLHDILPLQFPEYFKPGEDVAHERRLATVARHGAGVLVSSEVVAAAFRSACAARNLPVPPVHVLPIGVEAPFLSAAPAQSLPQQPYFLICGTIEPRKNHLLVLNLWRAMALEAGPDRGRVPKLLVVGRRGWENEAVVDMLERSPAIRSHVLELPDLSTPALRVLMQGAAALLMPSFAEGYGIPIVEALSAGTPVLCSDTPEHREVGRGVPDYLDPLDGPGWRAAIADYTMPGSPRATAQRLRLSRFSPPTWDAHFAALDDLLSGTGRIAVA